jgi:hypothetical protein
MTDKTEILTSKYGATAPKAAKFGVGAATLEEINQATEAARANTNATAPRKYAER